jgi:hypothetical protein
VGTTAVRTRWGVGRIGGVDLGVDADGVADREFPAIAVEHVHHPQIGIEVDAGGGFVLAAGEDRAIVGVADLELWLEEPGLVAELLGLALGVDEEEGDEPAIGELAGDPGEEDLGLIEGEGARAERSRREIEQD